MLCADGPAGARDSGRRLRLQVEPAQGKEPDLASTSATARGGLGLIERIIRILGGGVLALFALYLWLTTGGLVAWAWFAAALLGLDFVVTGVRGYCPLYARLGMGRPRNATDA